MDIPYFTIEFWQRQLSGYANLGNSVPILLAALESFIPPLPLVGIVTLNIAAHGVLKGILLSWIGTSIGCTCVFWFMRLVVRRFFIRAETKHTSIRKAEKWVETIGVPALFFIVIMPFTPSAFINFAFGISEYPAPKYLLTLYAGKLVMISLLGVFGDSFVKAFENPVLFLVAVGIIVLLYWLSRKVTQVYKINHK
ncbi:MAG: TVP38/TMEM64 family protein [Clostridia bacterium]|nr:TVP38/TMEM64 family protein [Clostridia bacterium]